MSTFALQIVTPDGAFYDGEAEKVIVRTIDGDVCILPHHTEYITALGTGEARVTVDGEVHVAACSGGLLAVTGNKVRVVATTFEWEENIDAERAIQARDTAMLLLEKAEGDADIKLAKAKLARALTRIKVAGK